jgi:hypothetical protein
VCDRHVLEKLANGMAIDDSSAVLIFLRVTKVPYGTYGYYYTSICMIL